MIDRDYLKFNTSIQTGSNAATTKTDDKGNIEATIELRLPDNIFSGGVGPKKIEKVRMQTSKMRLSLENTPIAQIPLDPDLSTTDKPISTCKLDVFPYTYTNEGKWAIPSPRALSYYNGKIANIKLRIQMNYGSENTYMLEYPYLEIPYGASISTPAYLARDLIDKKVHASKNMYIPNNHETLNIEDNMVLIKSVSTLVQMWQDVLEVALTTGANTFTGSVILTFAQTNTRPTESPYDIHYSDTNYGELYLLNVEQTTTDPLDDKQLKAAIKPEVRFGGQSLTIAYDSAPFPSTCPMIWNPSFVNTMEHPPQFRELSSVTTSTSTGMLAPPRRRARYTTYNGTTTTSYSFSINTGTGAQFGCVNIVGNKATAETFSFLPWIKVLDPWPSLGGNSRSCHYVSVTGTYKPTKYFSEVTIIYNPDPSYPLNGPYYNEYEYTPPVTYQGNPCFEVTYKVVNGVKTNIVCNYGTRGTYQTTGYFATTKTFSSGAGSERNFQNLWPDDMLSFKRSDMESYITPVTSFPTIITSNQNISPFTQNVISANQLQIHYSSAMVGNRLCYATAKLGANTWYMLVGHPQDSTQWVDANPRNRAYPTVAPTHTFVDSDGVTHEYFRAYSNNIREHNWNIHSGDTVDIIYKISNSSIKPSVELTLSFTQGSTVNPLTYFPSCEIKDEVDNTFYILDGSDTHVTITDPENVGDSANNSTAIGNVRLSFTWDNLPIVVMSPITSIVLTLQGIQVDQEVQPINIAQPTGSSLTSTIPVIENFYSLAQTLRDLHDELVVVKDSFDDTATYTVAAQSGSERTLHLSAKYITKDGSLHQIYIPPKGVFSVQLTFGISYYIS